MLRRPEDAVPNAVTLDLLDLSDELGRLLPGLLSESCSMDILVAWARLRFQTGSASEGHAVVDLEALAGSVDRLRELASSRLGSAP